MIVEEILLSRKTHIIKRCLNLIMATYPPEYSGVFENSGDRFQNPVGFTICNEIEHIYSELIGKMDMNMLSNSLESIIKIRAVQEFTPSEAISFVFLLKKAIKEEITKGEFAEIEGTKPGGGYVEAKILKGLFQLDEKIDRIAFLAFDIYMNCREKIYEIRLKEIKSGIR
jgi:hypothetical protein